VKTILTFIDWYLPAYKAGGPIRSCANMISHLKDDFNFKIICSSFDLNESKMLDGIESGVWTKAPDGTEILYINPLQLNFAFIQRMINEVNPDLIYLNSIYSKFYTLYPLWANKKRSDHIPVIIAPRGMLGKGSLAQKAFKKKVFLMLAKALGLFSNVVWHCSTAQESKEVEKTFDSKSIRALAINLSEKKKIEFVEIEKTKGDVKLIWLARISSVKNFKGAVESIVKIKPMYKVQFDVYGPSDDERYFNECLSIVQTAAPHIRINFFEAVPHQKVGKLLSQYHFMFLPTFNENFGHGIVDAFMASCPVLISNTTPWKNLEEEYSGMVINGFDPSDYALAIEKICNMDQSAYDIYRKGAYNKAIEIINNPVAKNAHIEMFSNSIKHG